MSKDLKTFISRLTSHKLAWLEWASIVFSVWFVVYPKPYVVLFTILLIIPILGLVLRGLKGKPSIASLVVISKNGFDMNEYTVSTFILFPAISILGRIWHDYTLVEFTNWIVPLSMVFTMMIMLLLRTHRRIEQTVKNKVWIYTSVVACIMLYSVGGVVGANCVFDTSTAEVFDAQVLDKTHRSRRLIHHYKIGVSPYVYDYPPNFIKVKKDKWNELEMLQAVSLIRMKGLFNIPWHYIK